MLIRGRTVRSTVFPAVRAAPWLRGRKIRAPSAATPAAKPPRIRAGIFRATSNTPASTLPACRSPAISPPRTPPASLTTTMLPFTVLSSTPPAFSPRPCVSALSSSPFLRLLWKFKTILRQCGARGRALHKFQKRQRRLLILGVLQNNRSLFKRRMHLRRNLPAPSIAHRRRNSQRHRHNPRLRIPRLHKLRRLRNIFSVDQLGLDGFVDSRLLQRRHCRASVWRMLRIGDRNLLDARIQQGFPSLFCNIHFRIRRRPNHDSPYGVFIQGPRRRESCCVQLFRIPDVRGKEQIERRPILHLREKVSARPVSHTYFGSRLLLKLPRQFTHRKLQIRGRRYADFLSCSSHLTLPEEKRDDEWQHAEQPKPVCFSTSHKSQVMSHTLKIITSVDLISAAARSPGFNRSSFAASAVMIEVMCCSPIASVTCASSLLHLIATTRPISWFRPLIFRRFPRRVSKSPRSSFFGNSRSISLSGTR